MSERPEFQTQAEYDEWHDAHVCVNCGETFKSLNDGGYCLDCKAIYSAP